MRCAMRRDASDAIAIRNAQASIYFLLFHRSAVDHLVLRSAVIPPVVAAWGGSMVARQPWKGWSVVLGHGKGVFLLPLHPFLVIFLAYPWGTQRPCSHFLR